MQNNKPEQKLNSCPFCGGKAQLYAPHNMNHVYVECDNCDARSGYIVNEERAIKMWNMREYNFGKISIATDYNKE